MNSPREGKGEVRPVSRRNSGWGDVNEVDGAGEEGEEEGKKMVV